MERKERTSAIKHILYVTNHENGPSNSLGLCSFVAIAYLLFFPCFLLLFQWLPAESRGPLSPPLRSWTELATRISVRRPIRHRRWCMLRQKGRARASLVSPLLFKRAA